MLERLNEVVRRARGVFQPPQGQQSFQPLPPSGRPHGHHSSQQPGYGPQQPFAPQDYYGAPQYGMPPAAGPPIGSNGMYPGMEYQAPTYVTPPFPGMPGATTAVPTVNSSMTPSWYNPPAAALPPAGFTYELPGGPSSMSYMPQPMTILPSGIQLPVTAAPVAPTYSVAAPAANPRPTPPPPAPLTFGLPTSPPPPAYGLPAVPTPAPSYGMPQPMELQSPPITPAAVAAAAAPPKVDPSPMSAVMSPGRSAQERGLKTGKMDYHARCERGSRPYLEDTVATKAAEGIMLFGVFDGHGGAKASDYCKSHLLELIAQRLDPRVENTTQAISAAFWQVDEQFSEMARHYGWNDGSTALVVCLRDGWLHIAHCGDTRLVLVRDGSPPYAALTQDHRPDNAREYERIVQLGGTVVHRPGDAARVVPGHLAVSRSIGDTRAKPIVTADPEVQSMLVDATWRALVLATDGLWDVVTPALCAEVCLRSPSAHHAADQLVDLAISMKSTDNVSVMVVMLRA